MNLILKIKKMGKMKNCPRRKEFLNLLNGLEVRQALRNERKKAHSQACADYQDKIKKGVITTFASETKSGSGRRSVTPSETPLNPK